MIESPFADTCSRTYIRHAGSVISAMGKHLNGSRFNLVDRFLASGLHKYRPTGRYYSTAKQDGVKYEVNNRIRLTADSVPIRLVLWAVIELDVFDHIRFGKPISGFILDNDLDVHHSKIIRIVIWYFFRE